MTLVLAIDPGPERSAYVVLRDGRGVEEHATVANDDLVRLLASPPGLQFLEPGGCRLVIEMIASYGMPVGREVFETCVAIGRFIEAWRGRAPAERLTRLQVKLHLCHSARATDANIRQALIDRFGPGKERAIGTKSNPGHLYGVHGDEWAALAVAVMSDDARRAALR